MMNPNQNRQRRASAGFYRALVYLKPCVTFHFGALPASCAQCWPLQLRRMPSEGPDPFRWMNFHSQKDQDIITWVTQALANEKWTAIREIGVEYDAALVVTTLRAAPDSPANQDAFQVWSVSLTTHALTPLVNGFNLRWLESLTFAEGEAGEMSVLYDSCSECAPETYFTAFHFDLSGHMWAARWMRGGQGVPLWSANMPPSVALTQVYAGFAEANGRALVGTWSHFDYGGAKPTEDFVYRYEVDPLSRLERTQQLSGRDADALKLRICRAWRDICQGWLEARTPHFARRL